MSSKFAGRQIEKYQKTIKELENELCLVLMKKI
jgi:hypothetical protein